MSFIQIGQLVAVTCLLTVGQVLFRRGATSAGKVTDLGSLLQLFLSPYIIAAVALYGGTTLLYVYTLQTVPLSRAYPFMALGFVLVPLAAVLVLHEPVSWRYFLGLALVLGGLYLSTSGEG
jgi:undecaprenyl phosphate-alpha-L-ara4N flippase subunit ArnE